MLWGMRCGRWDGKTGERPRTQTRAEFEFGDDVDTHNTQRTHKTLKTYWHSTLTSRLLAILCALCVLCVSHLLIATGATTNAKETNDMDAQATNRLWDRLTGMATTGKTCARRPIPPDRSNG